MKTIQGRAGGDVVVTTLRLPRELMTEVKIQAIRMGRSFNTHVAMILAKAAGAEFGDATPAAGKAQEEPDQQETQNHAAE